MKKILFIDRYQFGYTTDTLKYCEYLNQKYKIKYISFDLGWKKIKVPNVNTIYVPRYGNIMMRAVLFLIYAIVNCLFFHGTIFILYFPKCSLLKRILFWKKMHIDIRTLAVNANFEERENINKQIQKDIVVFDSASFITQGVKEQISWSGKQYFILPLGSDILSHTNKNFNEFNLLYVGTLANRNIIETVKGYENFIKLHPDIKSHYDIIGDSSGNELDELKQYINKKGLDKYITLHGRLPYTELSPFFDSHNIGISYVPITDYYNYQPPTKTYEYILSGLVCIATSTYSNKEIITPINGILHQDNIESFQNALEIILKNKEQYNSQHIRESLYKYQWENIIKESFLPIINKSL